ncbi:MAG: hypothetical protein A2033_07605 [Bacteroidetes bacterium GWA2_31_9]|nr:MAG: hypothetical protein A2033_07605 [Bacteroidetes bacterium GWA2_31_9]
MKTIALLFVAAILIFFGCKKDSEPRDSYFKQSTFIEDEGNPGLPIYSELGYNTFGAYYDRETFVSNDIDVPFKIIVTNDTTTLIFKGTKNYKDMTLKIGIPDNTPDIYNDMLTYNDTIIDLTQCKITTIINGSTSIAQVIDGRLEIKKAQKLFVDDSEIEVVLAGIFEFQLLINNEPIAISNGRFDFGVGYSNFFAY